MLEIVSLAELAESHLDMLSSRRNRKWARTQRCVSCGLLDVRVVDARQEK